VSDGEVLVELLKLSTVYSYQTLQMICQNELKNSLDSSNVPTLLLVAELYKAQDLYSNCYQFIAENYPEVETNGQDFKTLNKNLRDELQQKYKREYEQK
jgi:hypothetical protein